MLTRRSGRRVGVALCAALFAVLLAAGCTSGPLDESEPSEVVLRNARLGGFENTAVGEDADTAWVQLDLPGLNSAADIEIAWQTGFASLAVAYPRADAYRVVVSLEGAELLGIEADADDVSAAIEADDADALRESATFTYLSRSDTSVDAGADLLVAGVDVAESYLDAKNRAAGLLGAGDGAAGPVGLKASQLESESESMRASVEGKTAIPPGEAAAVYAQRILQALDGTDQGEEEPLSLVDRLANSAYAATPAEVSELRAASILIEAVTRTEAFGSLLEPAAGLAGTVAAAPLESGPPSDAVLVEARDPEAPVSAKNVSEFEREPDSDVTPDDQGSSLAAHALGFDEGAWLDAGGTSQRFESREWRAYRRADGTLYWISDDESGHALTDGSVRGWAFSRPQVAVVNPADVGELLGSIRLPGIAHGGNE